MSDRRRQLALCVVLGLVGSIGLAAQSKDEKKRDEAQRKEIQGIQKFVDDAAAGQPMPNDFSIAWAREDVLKAQGNKQYVPFTVTIDPTKATGERLALYWRVMSKEQAAAAAAASAATGKKDEKKDDKNKPKQPTWAYEDVRWVPLAGAQNPLRISKSFTVPAGTYDVYVVAKEPSPEKPAKNAPAPKMSVLKQTVTVPDFWNTELQTSSVIMGPIVPLPAPLTPEQQADRPYALGSMEIQPVFDTKLTKKGELSVFMLIYNPKTDKDNKPDILVEYNFCQVSPGAEAPKPNEPCKAGEKFFNKTEPQKMNAQTLPPAFDFAAGHQLQTGQAVPLSSFPEGQWRLEIKITDKLANKTITRDVNFTVSPS